MNLTHTEVKNKVSSLVFENRAFIDGQYVTALSGKTFDCINPATGQLLTQVAACDKEDIDRAVKAARLSFERGVWSKTAPLQRKKILLKFAELIEQQQAE